MPGIFDNKIFNAEVFGRYVETIPNLQKTELLKSKAIRPRPDLKSMMSDQVGGNFVSVPLKGLISGAAPLNYDGTTDISSQSTKTFMHSRVVIGRAQAWTEKDFSYDITGGQDFLENVATQIADYWNEVDQDTILAILQGIFNMSGAANKKFVDNHTVDITADTTNNGRIAETTINSAMQKALGDNKSKFSLSIMHSVVATNLENLKLLVYMKYNDANGLERDLALGTVHGRLVLVDDGMPTEDVPETTAGAGDGYNKYTTYILGEGAIEYTDAGAKVPYEVDRDPKTNGGQDTLYSRQRKSYAPYGISFTMSNMATASPTDSELKNGTNWELVNTKGSSKEYIDHKAIPIARLISRG